MKKLLKKLVPQLPILVLSLLLVGSCKKNDDSTNSTPTNETVTDFDGNIYHTVKIGSQVWMVENLKTTTFNDGTPIDPISTKKSSDSWEAPHYCWYNNDPSNKDKYGALYNYWVIRQTYVVPLVIAPKGWHIPSDDEWNTLITYLGGDSIAGGKMKTTGSIETSSGLWYEPNEGANNISGFSAVPGGYTVVLDSLISFEKGYRAAFWSTTRNQYNTYYYEIYSANTIVKHLNNGTYHSEYRTIRCIKD